MQSLLSVHLILKTKMFAEFRQDFKFRLRKLRKNAQEHYQPRN